MAWFPLRRAGVEPVNRPDERHPLLAGRYRLGHRLGRSAAATVREAIDLRTGGSVAVKLIDLPADLAPAHRSEWLSRLQRETALGRLLHHPNIVAVQDAGLDGHQVWMVMERVRGVDLGRYTQPQRLLPEPLVLDIGARVGAALAHAHARGIVHRDLKPANVLVNLETGQVKLADFGVARLDDSTLTRTGVTLGTPSYMAPELLAGHAASPASDVYALGVVMFELLAGRRPHQADTLGELLAATARQPPAALAGLRPDLPAPVVQTVEALLARDPAVRPSDLAAWAADTAALAALISRVLNPATAPRL